MKKLLLTLGMVLALVLAFALTRNPDQPVTEASDGIAQEDAAPGTDDLPTTNTDVAIGTLGDVGDVAEDADAAPVPDPKLPEVEEDITTDPIAVDRASALADLQDFVSARSADLEDRLAALTAERTAGTNVEGSLADLVDDITIFGEGAVTGISFDPQTVAAVPDIQEVHASLIAEIDRLYAAALALDPSSADDVWEETVARVVDHLHALPTVLD